MKRDSRQHDFAQASSASFATAQYWHCLLARHADFVMAQMQPTITSRENESTVEKGKKKHWNAVDEWLQALQLDKPASSSSDWLGKLTSSSRKCRQLKAAEPTRGGCKKLCLMTGCALSLFSSARVVRAMRMKPPPVLPCPS